MNAERGLFPSLVNVTEASWKDSMTYKVVKGPPRVKPYEIHLRRTLHLNFSEEGIANYQGCAVCTLFRTVKCFMEPRSLIVPCPSSLTSTLITSIFCIIRALVQLTEKLGSAPYQSVNYIALWGCVRCPTGRMEKTRKSSFFIGNWFLLHLLCCQSKRETEKVHQPALHFEQK